MKEICLKFASKVQMNLDDIYFIYCGTLVTLDLKLNQIINPIDSQRNEINVLVYEKEKEGIESPIVENILILMIIFLMIFQILPIN